MVSQKISEIIDQLIALQQQELRLMKTGKAQQASALTVPKQALTVSLNACFQSLNEDIGLRHQLTHQDRDTLMAKLETLHGISLEVQKILKGYADKQTLFLEHLKNKAREAEQLTNAYSAHGKVKPDKQGQMACLTFSYEQNC